MKYVTWQVWGGASVLATGAGLETTPVLGTRRVGITGTRFPNPYRLVAGGLVGATLLMVGERGLLDQTDLFAYSAVTLWVLLPVLLLCHWFPYVVTTSALLHVAERLGRAWRPDSRRRRVLRTLALLLAPLTYSVWLSLYTFDGPQARLLWYRPIALVGLPLLLTLVLALPLLALARAESKRKWPLLVALGALTAAGLAANRLVLPDEYEPLHVYLALVSLLSVSSFGALVADRWQPPARRGLLALSGALLVALSCMLVTSYSHVLSFFVYSQAPASRYLATRLDLDVFSGEALAGGLQLKPDLAWDRQVAEKARATRAARPAPHIIVVSIDNVQMSRVGAYGYTKNPTTPNIDRLAKRGMVFETAYSWFPKTRMFLSSMLYGRLLPPFTDHEFGREYKDSSITRLLHQRDYLVLVKGWFDRSRHFKPTDLAFDAWMPPSAEDERRRTRGQPYVPMQENYRTIRRFFARAQRRNRPVFAWMHFLRAHRLGTDAFLGDASRGFGNTRSDAYDSAIAVADGYLPKLQQLARRYLEPDRPVYWVVMSDHGTGFSSLDGVTTFDDGCNIAERFTRVPLIVVGPDIRPGRSDILVSSSIDTAATILDLVGLTPPQQYDGVSLMPALAGYLDRSAADRRAIYLNYYTWRGVVHRRHKLVVQRGGVSLVQLEDDPNERSNVADEQRRLVRSLEKVVLGERERISQGASGEPPDED